MSMIEMHVAALLCLCLIVFSGGLFLGWLIYCPSGIRSSTEPRGYWLMLYYHGCTGPVEKAFVGAASWKRAVAAGEAACAADQAIGDPYDNYRIEAFE